jgi:hypothetical protein
LATSSPIEKVSLQLWTCSTTALYALLAHLAHTHALSRACSGISDKTSGVKIASMHQQRSGLVSVALAFSIAQTFGS